ncbi:MAG TPA: response regulator [Desulfobacteraceae bacterium]|nr:response regulator [Desulfobacteraceae bacterium]
MNRTTLLTIDDEPYIRKSIRLFFEDYGFSILEADNGRTGIDLFKEKQPDIVLLDLRMPQMDGLEVLEILKESSPLTPVIVASGTGNVAAVVDALHLGAWDYILKPVQDMNVLLHSVKKCLNTRRLQEENMAYQEHLEAVVKERTRELEESQEKYRAMFECTGTATAILEKDTTISMVNDEFARLAGRSAEGIQWKTKWSDFVFPDDLEMMQRCHEARRDPAAGSDVPKQYTFRFLSGDKKTRHIYLTVGMIPGTDRSVASLLDVTEQKMAETRWKELEKQLRKAQRMEAVGTLAGGIAHDLNNILSPVLGYADMIMRESDPDGTVYSRSGKIQKAAYRAADLVRQILSFSRTREEKARAVAVHPIAREVVKLLHGSIPSTIEIVDSIQRNCGYVKADPTQIHQVLMNLCTNAYHAMETNGGRLVVSLEEKQIIRDNPLEYPGVKRGKYLLLAVSDTGCGMDEAVQERLFDPYFTTKEEGKGTGLGLATVYSIVKSCSGEIGVKSAPGEGTVITILLPAVEEHVRVEQTVHHPKTLEKIQETRLLVVDDDREIADMYKEGFELLGYRVVAFYSGVDALNYFSSHADDVDVVVTDQTMPGKTGFEMAGEMLAVKNDIAIILCSGHSEAVNDSKAEKAGIKRFVLKPISVEKLSSIIQKVID